MAGEAYAKRYVGGFVDLPSQTTSIDSQFLNAVEASLSRLLGADPTDDCAQVWDAGLARFKTIKLTASEISPTAAIAKTQLAALNITDADVAAGANISGSKLGTIPASKLNGYPSDATKILYGDGSWAVPASAPVSSVFGRTGAVVKQAGDYLASDVTNAADKISGTQQTFAADISTGPLSNAIGAAPGNFIGAGSAKPYILSLAPTGSPTTAAFDAGVQGDTTAWRFTIDHAGKLSWGAQNTAQDTNLYRSGVGILTTDGVLTAGNGFITVQAAGALVIKNQISLITDANPAWQVTGLGVITWGAGTTNATDTTLQRASGGKGLQVSNYIRETGGVVATYGTTVNIDPTLGNHFTITITNATAFTINTPSPALAAGTTQRISIEFINTSGSVSGNINFSTAYQGASLTGIAVSGTAGSNHMMYTFQWSPTTSKWVYVGGSSSY